MLFSRLFLASIICLLNVDEKEAGSIAISGRYRAGGGRWLLNQVVYMTSGNGDSVEAQGRRVRDAGLPDPKQKDADKKPSQTVENLKTMEADLDKAIHEEKNKPVKTEEQIERLSSILANFTNKMEKDNAKEKPDRQISDQQKSDQENSDPERKPDVEEVSTNETYKIDIADVKKGESEDDGDDEDEDEDEDDDDDDDDESLEEEEDSDEEEEPSSEDKKDKSLQNGVAKEQEVIDEIEINETIVNGREQTKVSIFEETVALRTPSPPNDNSTAEAEETTTKEGGDEKEERKSKVEEEAKVKEVITVENKDKKSENGKKDPKGKRSVDIKQDSQKEKKKGGKLIAEVKHDEEGNRTEALSIQSHSETSNITEENQSIQEGTKKELHSSNKNGTSADESIKSNKTEERGLKKEKISIKIIIAEICKKEKESNKDKKQSQEKESAKENEVSQKEEETKMEIEPGQQKTGELQRMRKHRRRKREATQKGSQIYVKAAPSRTRRRRLVQNHRSIQTREKKAAVFRVKRERTRRSEVIRVIPGDIDEDDDDTDDDDYEEEVERDLAIFQAVESKGGKPAEAIKVGDKGKKKSQMQYDEIKFFPQPKEDNQQEAPSKDVLNALDDISKMKKGGDRTIKVIKVIPLNLQIETESQPGAGAPGAPPGAPGAPPGAPGAPPGAPGAPPGAPGAPPGAPGAPPGAPGAPPGAPPGPPLAGK